MKKLFITGLSTLLLSVSNSSVLQAVPKLAKTVNTWRCYSEEKYIGNIKSNTTVFVYDPLLENTREIRLGDLSTQYEAGLYCTMVYPQQCYFNLTQRCSAKKTSF